jgi:hypothetical protein
VLREDRPLLLLLAVLDERELLEALLFRFERPRLLEAYDELIAPREPPEL